jgi:hypothetical protein
MKSNELEDFSVERDEYGNLESRGGMKWPERDANRESAEITKAFLASTTTIRFSSRQVLRSECVDPFRNRSTGMED